MGTEDTAHKYADWGRPLLDAAVLAAGLPIALPTGLAIALANLIQFRDPRKILFVQERMGKDGRPFSIYKFRTMQDAPKGAMDSWSNGGDQARVTALGKLLRKTHLDELPQLLNVAFGDMSILGPRPEMVEVHEWAMETVPGFERRLDVKPGLTGLAQVTQGYTGRDADAYREKLLLDETHMDRMGLGYDLGVLAKTLLWMIKGKGWSFQPLPAEQLAQTLTEPVPEKRVSTPLPAKVTQAVALTATAIRSRAELMLDAAPSLVCLPESDPEVTATFSS